MIIYFDMDGVLTNFKKRIEEYKAEGKQTDYEFWVSLEELLDKNVVLPLASRHQVGIITALPNKPKHAFDAELGKRKWLNDHYSGVFDPIYITSNSKAQYCKPGDILIDNKQSNIDAWKSAGGIGIYFDGYTQSSEDLIGELIPELSMS